MSIKLLFEEESDPNDPSSDTRFDLAGCCRTCLQHECSLTPTNSSDSDSIKFCDKLAACMSGMKWAKEGVPSFICGPCIEKLRIAYDFQIICLQSDQILQLQAEASDIRSSRNVTPDPTTTTDLAECDKTIENVTLSVKAEETQVQPLPQHAPVTSARAQLEALQTLDNPCKDSCEDCGKELCEHNQKHIGKNRLQCSVCNKQFTVTAELTAHMRTHTKEKPHACNVCQNRYVNKADLLVHLYAHRKGTAFTCSYCNEKFTTKCLLNSHLKTHTGNNWPCLICNKSYTKPSQLSRHMNIHTEEKFSCKFCDRTFTCRDYLNKHMRIHTEKKYSCQFCDKKFTDSYPLNIHMKRHTGEKFSCKTCEQKFTHISQLRIHMRKHTGKQPHKCTFCNKVCKGPSELKTHMMRHTGEKLTCPRCNKEFISKYLLNCHLKTHAANYHLTQAGESRFNCWYCDRIFTAERILKRHMRTHMLRNL